MPDKKEKKEPTKEEKLAELNKELEELKKEEVPKEEEKPEEPEPEPPELPDRDKTGKFTKKDPETPKEKDGEDKPTPLTEKEVAELVDEKVREALKIKRKEPSKATPVSEPVNRAAITKNWFEEIV